MSSCWALTGVPAGPLSPFCPCSPLSPGAPGNRDDIQCNHDHMISQRGTNVTESRDVAVHQLTLQATIPSAVTWAPQPGNACCMLCSCHQLCKLSFQNLVNCTSWLPAAAAAMLCNGHLHCREVLCNPAIAAASCADSPPVSTWMHFLLLLLLHCFAVVILSPAAQSAIHAAHSLPGAPGAPGAPAGPGAPGKPDKANKATKLGGGQPDMLDRRLTGCNQAAADNHSPEDFTSVASLT
jgi:hypothetical protein